MFFHCAGMQCLRQGYHPVHHGDAEGPEGGHPAGGPSRRSEVRSWYNERSKGRSIQRPKERSREPSTASSLIHTIERPKVTLQRTLYGVVFNSTFSCCGIAKRSGACAEKASFRTSTFLLAGMIRCIFCFHRHLHHASRWSCYTQHVSYVSLVRSLLYLFSPDSVFCTIVSPSDMVSMP